MERITRLIRNKAQDLQENLESILDMNGLEKPEIKKFELNTDLTTLKNAILPKKTIEDSIIQAFSKLSSYFESGLLLYKKDDQHKNETWVSGAAFLEGSYFPLTNEILSRKLILPKLNYFEMKKCSPYLVLQPLGLNQIGDHSDANAFIIKVHEHFAMILISHLPEPWLRIHIETIYYSFLKRNLENG